MEKSFLTSSTKTKRSFYRRKLHYQGTIIEQSTSSLPATSMLEPNYLTAKIIGNISRKMTCDDSEDSRIVQEMELKSVGKLGMVKRKQFLQKRDISRSHEVK